VKVLVDTSVWSLAFRRRQGVQPQALELQRLVQEGLVEIIGPIRQELLSGFSEPKQFENLRSHMASFEDLPLLKAHFETAAEFSNRCRKHGVQGSSTYFLICAVGSIERCSIFTTDQDFHHFAKHLPINLHKVRS